MAARAAAQARRRGPRGPRAHGPRVRPPARPPRARRGRGRPCGHPPPTGRRRSTPSGTSSSRLKRDVPIWKKEHFEDGAVWVGTPTTPRGERGGPERPDDRRHHPGGFGRDRRDRREGRPRRARAVLRPREACASRCCTHVLDEAAVRAVVEQAKQRKALLVYTIVGVPARACSCAGWPRRPRCARVDLLSGLLLQMAMHFGEDPLYTPGLGHELDAEYFRRVDAVEFAVNNDDGTRAEEPPARRRRARRDQPHAKTPLVAVHRAPRLPRRQRAARASGSPCRRRSSRSTRGASSASSSTRRSWARSAAPA